MSQSIYNICGIQQIGLGNNSVYDTWDWYRKNLGMDLPVFDEAAVAELMLPYTGGEPKSRHAILALNHGGGGGLEIWQHKTRDPQPLAFELRLGDLGILMAKYKCHDADKSHQTLSKNGVHIVSPVSENPVGDKHFYAKDLHGNLIEVIESKHWFRKKVSHAGGIYGSVIGVSDIEKSIPFYKELLGYDTILFDGKDSFDDWKGIAGSEHQIRRVILGNASDRKGPFSPLLGRTQIELVQNLEETPRQLFKDRMWGDLGYIHLCYDVTGMDNLKMECQKINHPFTVDSGQFDMGEAAGRFAYVEDPDGTLIEFVETHKIPIMKKWNWFLDLQKRDANKSLPRWILLAMGLNRVKGEPTRITT